MTAAGFLAVLVIGVEGYLFLHAQGRRRLPEPGPTDLGAPPPASAPLPPNRQGASAGAAPVAAEMAPPDRTTEVAIPDDQPAGIVVALRRRDQLVATHNQQAILEADERAFADLGIAEPTRIAIRQLNERQARRHLELVAGEGDGLTPQEQAGVSVAIGERVNRERQLALKEILGPDTAQSFQSAENAAIRRVQRRYRTLWAQELDEQAPLPAGLPPRAH